MGRTTDREIIMMRVQYAEEINSGNPNYEKLCDLYERIRERGGAISREIKPERYKPCQT